MKKILSGFLVAIIIVLVGCGVIEKKDSIKSTILIDSAIDYLTIQFKTNVVKIEDDEKINSIKEMFEGELKRNKELDDVKGWIYTITGKDSNDNQIEEFIIIDDTNIRIKDKAYTCKKIDISRLDEIAGIDREN